MNFMLIMKNEKSDLVAIGPLAIEYQAAVLRDELEESSDWTSVGIARILTETQARARLKQTDVYRVMFKPLKATLSGRDTTVLIKLVVDGLTDRVVGCHIVGEGAAEIIQLVAITVKMRATKADFDAALALHPTTAEELVTMRQKSASYARAAAE